MMLVKTKALLIIICIIMFTVVSAYSLNYITTAESISWNGAYSSVADGFEAMLYNPAGLYYSHTKYGINILGTYGFRLYNNSFSSNDILGLYSDITAGKNLTSSGTIDKLLSYMPETGFDIGFDLSMANIMTYMKLANFSLGFALIPKTYATFTIDKALFADLFGTLDLTKEISYSVKFNMVQYLDLNVVLSTRAKFLEKVIPVEAIYTGMTVHFYFPTVYARGNSKVSLRPGSPNSELFGVIDNYYLNMEGEMVFGANSGITEALKLVPGANEQAGSILNTAGSGAFGLGFDLGFMVKFNRFIRLGFAATDIGFIVFPKVAKTSFNEEILMDFQDTGAIASDMADFAADNILGGEASEGQSEWWMPNTSLRVGVAVTPFKNNIITWSSDIAVSDLNRLINDGYPTFNFSTGIEFLPGYKWFFMPIRVAFNYNSQANVPSFSLGTGLYLGPVEMEIAVKGLEILIKDWGAKEVSVGFDLKFEF